MFYNFDKNNDGYISMNELREGLEGRYSEHELEQIIRAIDTDKNGAINYTEFIAAALNSSVFLDEEKLLSAFDTLDKDGDGFIEEIELAEMLGYKDGDKIDHKMMYTLIKDIDLDSDGKIDFNEFKKMVSNISKEVKK